MAKRELTYSGGLTSAGLKNRGVPGWIVELLDAWARDDALLPIADQRGHPMWRRLDEPSENTERKALTAALAAMHAEQPEEYEAICRTFKPWVGMQATAEVDGAVLHTAIQRLADAVDAAMGD